LRSIYNLEDGWFKDAALSDALRRWFGHEENRCFESMRPVGT
jgi:uncharacterized protein YeaO (DUF488 family)